MPFKFMRQVTEVLQTDSVHQANDRIGRTTACYSTRIQMLTNVCVGKPPTPSRRATT